MIRMNKTGFMMVFGFFMVLVLCGFTNHRASASTLTTSNLKLYVNGVAKTWDSEVELKNEIVPCYVMSDYFQTTTTVSWESSVPTVVAISNDTNKGEVSLVRKGPGYSVITATVINGTQKLKASFTVKVALEINKAKTDLTTATTTSEQLLVLDSVGSTKQIYLKYVDDTSGSTPVAGGAITGSAVTYTSANENVVKVDENGKVTAIGAGKSEITISSVTTSSSEKKMTITVTAVVAPSYNLSYTSSSGASYSVNSKKKVTDSGGLADYVPSSFTLVSNAVYASNLTWVVYDRAGNKIDPATSSIMKYAVSEQSGTVNFTNVKAGTYDIYAFADKDYNTSTNAPYAYMRVIVPIDLGDTNLVMNVGDTYNVIENTNIPGKIFTSVTYIAPGTANIAEFDMKTYDITANMKGKVSFTLTYDPDKALFDSSIVVAPKTYNITVVDGIALSTTSAILYVKGTLRLDAIVTDSASAITWTSSDPTIAKVEDGLVTGLKEGKATITAKQTVDGVVKKATCIITVQKTVSSITVDPATTTLAIGAYQTLHATIAPSDLAGVTLQWRSSDDKVATIVESTAKTVTIQGVAGGHAVISAINQDNVVVGYCHVSVHQPVTSIVLSESNVTTLLTTKNVQLRATVYPENALNKTVTWTSSDTNKATVDANGMVTLKKTGTVSIIATSQDNPSVSAICNIEITVPVSSIALDQTVKTMYVGETARLSYILLPNNSSNAVVTWTSTNASVAAVDSAGKVTAKGPGVAVIILRATDGGYTAYCTITVKRIATGIKLDVSKLALKAGEYYYITAALTPKDSTETNITWESSDTKVATVDSKGKVIAKDSGSAIIMARIDNGAVAYCNVTVTKPVEGLILNFTEKTIFTNTKFTLEASIQPSSANNLNVTWSSSNTKVATVSSKGEVSGLVGGTAVITCKTADGGFTATCVVTVKEPVTKVTLDYETYNLGVGKSFKLTATVSNETATNQKVIWTSSNTKIATVNQNGKVTGVAKGYVTITAMALDGSEVEATCEVRVVNPVTSLTLNDNYITMFVGDSSTLKVTLRPTNATYKEVTWSSSDTSIAIVDQDGVVTGLKAGNATITAKAQDNSGKQSQCYVSVYDRVPSTGITLQDKKLTMIPGEEKIVQLVLIPAASTDSYTWSSDNPAVAKVNKTTGKIYARATGTAYITVMTDSGKTATVEVTVIGLNMTEMTLEQYTTYPYPLVVEGATSTVRWSIDKPQVAVVTNGYVSSRGIGKATISAVVNGRRLTCKLTVVKIN